MHIFVANITKRVIFISFQRKFTVYHEEYINVKKMYFIKAGNNTTVAIKDTVSKSVFIVTNYTQGRNV